ncbi:MAG: DUF523 domain-containing protein [Clostridia bacterium]|nr:DUF523 domain-containing protein [Clostridia bacterium]
MEEALSRLPEAERLVSLCDWPYRYDGNSKALPDERLARWAEEGRLVPICPEVMGGLPVPRDPSEIRCGRVISRSGVDVTEEYNCGAEEVLKLARELACEPGGVVTILKQGSPSCGSREIYDGTFSGRKIPGRGVAAEMLAEAGLTVFDETELDRAEALIAKNESRR